jgi:hypothetical protein
MAVCMKKALSPDPPSMPLPILALMKRCWAPDAADRPTMAAVIGPVAQSLMQADAAAKEAAEARNECIVCIDAPAPRSVALAPCGHVCSCEDCASDLQQCPICRQPIVSVTRSRSVQENHDNRFFFKKRHFRSMYLAPVLLSVCDRDRPTRRSRHVGALRRDIDIAFCFLPRRRAGAGAPSTVLLAGATRDEHGARARCEPSERARARLQHSITPPVSGLFLAEHLRSSSAAKPNFKSKSNKVK